MTFRIKSLPIVTAALLGLGAPAAAAQDAPTLNVGATVVDPQGGEVGTVTAIDAGHVTVRTDRHEVRLPATAVAATPEGRGLMSVTRDQLNAQMDQMRAQAAQAVQVGASVRARGGEVVGTIDSIDEEFVTIRASGGGLVRLPRNAVGASAQGAVIGFTAAEFAEQVPAGG